MPSVSISDLSVEFPVYGANSRSLKKLLVSQATGGRLMGQANDAVVVRALDHVSLEIQHARFVRSLSVTAHEADRSSIRGKRDTGTQ